MGGRQRLSQANSGQRLSVNLIVGDSPVHWCLLFRDLALLSCSLGLLITRNIFF